MSLTQALHEMAEQLGDEMTAGDLGPRFNCTEADSVARVLVLAGHRTAAVNFLLGHAAEDSDLEFDSHADMTEESVSEYITDNLAL